MRRNKNHICRLLLTGLFCLTVLGGCASEEGMKDSPADGSAAENTQMDLEMDEPDAEKSENIGDFSVQDIEGETYTQEMFADYDLTMVNVFTTWCTPCISEIPDLEKLKNEMADQNVNVVGIVLDAAGGTGGADEETIEKAKLLAERSGVTYPFLIPDAGYFNGRLAEINAVPETFFVDREGNFTGETYSGSRSFEEWKDIVEMILGGVTK